MIGVVKRIKDGGFFGFIESGGQDYFFHKENYEGSWGELRRAVSERGKKVYVSFEPTSGPKGLRAEEVKLSDGIS